MAETKLIISGPKETREVLVDPKGMTLGRGSNCDVILDDEATSRMHARIYQDPFERWIVEDLNSHNGVLIEGKRIKAHAVLPNQKITIHPFTLYLSLPYEKEKIPETTIQSSITVVDKGAEEVVSYEDREGVLSTVLIRNLNEITSKLLEVQSPSELYPEASYWLARNLDAFVAFVRLPLSPDPLPSSTQILACHFGKAASRDEMPQISNIHLSKHVLNAVRTATVPIMARNKPSSCKQIALTIADEISPHVVFSAQINDFDGTIDAIYIDILESNSPEQVFDFVEVVTRQIIFAQKSLILSEVKAERNFLDRQLSLAQDIQSKLVPGELKYGFEIDIAVCYKPAMWVGGDYYDVWPLENGQIAFAIGDVAGKGLPAALIMCNLQAALRTTMTFCSDLANVAQHVNKHLCQNLREDMFVTFFFGLFTPSENKLSYVNAGHVLPLIIHPSGPARPLGQVTHPPLGIVETSFEMVVEQMPPGTGLLVVTDGITESRSPDREFFQLKRLTKIISELKVQSAQKLVDLVVKEAEDFREPLPPQDDITVFALINQNKN
jgi:serine phosphatase RsbU (regulator of sigma subunit)